MFIPLDRKIDWAHPPVVTLLLIALNIALFGVVQYDDARATEQAFNYYADSELADIELPRYAAYLRSKGATDLPSETDRLLPRMLGDGTFMAQLRGGEVVSPEEAIHARWVQQRARFERLLNGSMIYRYGLQPAALAPSDLLVHMFLHGGTGHLIGNMIFLFIFGFVVEAAVGRSIFLGAYLLAGLASAGLDIAFRPDSLVPSIGASGAISGVVGMYTVLFGLRRIRFFYTVLFYFDYVRAPAIILLPLWLGFEVYYQLFDPSEVNRIAHIGGLLGGALIGMLAQRYSSAVDHAYLDAEEIRERRKRDYALGLDHMAAMELEAARAIFERLHAEEPRDRIILLQLYNISKFDPGSEAYHAMAHRILALPGGDAATMTLLHEVYREYVRIARPGFRFQGEQLIDLGIRFATAGYLGAAERIVAGFLQRKQAFPRDAEALLALALGFRRVGQQEKYERCKALLLERFSDSGPAHQLRHLLAVEAQA